MQLSHLELFAGIGGFRKAIDLFSEDNNYQSRCIAYSEFDKFAVQTYELYNFYSFLVLNQNKYLCELQHQ